MRPVFQQVVRACRYGTLCMTLNKQLHSNHSHHRRHSKRAASSAISSMDAEGPPMSDNQSNWVPHTRLLLTTSQTISVQYRQSEPVDMARFADHLANSYIPNTVIIDATASELPPALYLQWMQKGIHIITPNKKLGSGPLDQYLALRTFQRESYIHFFYEVA